MDFNQQTRNAWNQNAAYWDERMGEGNLFHRVLVGPATERLLQLKPGEEVLEIACGNGAFSRRMADLGARVTATDFSAQLLEHARRRTTENTDRIEYRLLDATDEVQLLALGSHHFDAAVCNMAIMDIAAIEPLLSALSQVLKTTGRFVFSIMHPCFNNPRIKLTLEEEDHDGEIVTQYAVKVPAYTHIPPQKGLAMIGQPVPHYYFHRTLSQLFNACFQAGFVLNGLEEPTFGEEHTGKGNRWFGWANFTDIPPALLARLVLK